MEWSILAFASHVGQCNNFGQCDNYGFLFVGWYCCSFWIIWFNKLSWYCKVLVSFSSIFTIFWVNMYFILDVFCFLISIQFSLNLQYLLPVLRFAVSNYYFFYLFYLYNLFFFSKGFLIFPGLTLIMIFGLKTIYLLFILF